MMTDKPTLISGRGEPNLMLITEDEWNRWRAERAVLTAEVARLTNENTKLRAIAQASDEYITSDHSDSPRAYGELVKAVKVWRPKVSEL